jgi:phosphatidylinositol glycan class B
MVYRWKDALVWTILPFLLIHFYIGHKELRFLFPAIGLLPLVAVTAGELVNEKWPSFFTNAIVKVLVLLFWVQNALFTFIVSIKAADAQVAMYKDLYDKYDTPVVVYYIKDNPYCRALDVYYYKRTNLSVREIQALDEIKLLPDTTVLFATVKNDEGIVLEKNNEKIFSALPDWIKAFNAFNWVERTRFWKVYEVKNQPVKNQ